MISNPTIDLAFPVTGTLIPSDHGYALYGALSREIPELHGADWLGIQGISARRVSAKDLSLERCGRLRVRIPAARIGELLALSGKTIEVAGHPLVLGAPTVETLVPAATLDARLVVIRFTGGLAKPFDPAVFENRFRAEADRQLMSLGVRGDLAIVGRQSLRVGGQRVIGCSVRVGGLNADDSLKLQVEGLGGKRMMGCGIFRPARIRMERKQAA